MKRIDLKIGFSCNNYCRFCIQGNKRDKYPDKSTKEIKATLEKSRKEAEGVVFTGGEPAFRPKSLLEWVKYAKKIGYKSIQIQTNGRMFAYKDYCQSIIEAGANEFSPAIHGSNPQIHDYLTRAPGSWKQTVQGIKNLKSLGQYVLTNSVICKPNYKDLPNLAKLLVNLKVDQFQLAFVHINEIIAHDKKLIEETIPRYLEVEPYVKKGLRIGINAGINVMTEAIPFCFMKGYENYIAEKIIPETHVFDANFEVKNYSKYRKTQGKAKGPNCKKCKYYNICEGAWKEYPQIFGWDEFRPVIA
jgi:radical SAM protein with 4Fe4S-binding SPASM domain